MSVSTIVTPRRLAAATLATAAVLGAVALPASASDHARPDRPRVEITSVHHDSGHHYRSNRALNKEWVELTNTTRHTINLDGWTLEEGEDGRTYTFDHFRLEGRSTVRVHTGEGHDTRSDVYQDRHNYVWDNDRDSATLRNDHGRVIDKSSWGNDRHHHGDRNHGGHHHNH